MIAAALAAMPLAQKVEDGVASAIAQGVGGLFTLGQSHSHGQKLPDSAGSAGTNPSASSGAAAPARFSSAVMSALLALQETGAGGHG